MSEERTNQKPADYTLLKTRTAPEPPKKYFVLLLNDDFTPMDFVVKVIVQFFGIEEQLAYTLMIQVHEQGSAKVGEFDKGVAETLCLQVNDFAKSCGHPLKCVYERE